MNQPSVRQVLRLYKDLLRYGKQLKLTEQNFYLTWIKEEFKQNKGLIKSDDIIYHFKKGQEVLKHKRIV